MTLVVMAMNTFNAVFATMVSMKGKLQLASVLVSA